MTNTPPPWTNPPPGYPMPGPAATGKDRTSLFGWLGIVIGFFCCGIVGIVLGILSLRDAKRYGQSLVLGWVAIVIGILQILGGSIYAVNR